MARTLPTGDVALGRRRAIGLYELLALGVLSTLFAVWALWTLLMPAGTAASYVNGTFGASTQADYQTDLDRRLAPQRAVSRG